MKTKWSLERKICSSVKFALSLLIIVEALNFENIAFGSATLSGLAIFLVLSGIFASIGFCYTLIGIDELRLEME